PIPHPGPSNGRIRDRRASRPPFFGAWDQTRRVHLSADRDGSGGDPARRLCPHRDSQRSERARAPCASRTPERQPNIIAATVFAARGALSSLVIVEFVFIWGGAGLTFVQALGNRRLELASA